VHGSSFSTIVVGALGKKRDKVKGPFFVLLDVDIFMP